MIIEKIKQVDNNCVRSSPNVKAYNEKELKSQLLRTIISNFRKSVQTLDIVQILPKLPK